MARRNNKSQVGEMSELQEQICIALFMLGRAGEANSRPHAAYSGMSISEILGGKWSDYRKRVAQSMTGWVETYYAWGKYYYRLTETGERVIENRLARCAKQGIIISSRGVFECA